MINIRTRLISFVAVSFVLVDATAAPAPASAYACTALAVYDSNLYLTDESGKILAKLPTNSDVIGEPSLSPDGTSAAYLTKTDRLAVVGTGVPTQVFDVAENPDLVNGAALATSWDSPDLVAVSRHASPTNSSFQWIDVSGKNTPGTAFEDGESCSQSPQSGIACMRGNDVYFSGGSVIHFDAFDEATQLPTFDLAVGEVKSLPDYDMDVAVDGMTAEVVSLRAGPKDQMAMGFLTKGDSLTAGIGMLKWANVKVGRDQSDPKKISVSVRIREGDFLDQLSPVIAWAPDSKRVAVVRRRAEGQNLVVLERSEQGNWGVTSQFSIGIGEAEHLHFLDNDTVFVDDGTTGSIWADIRTRPHSVKSLPMSLPTELDATENSVQVADWHCVASR